MITQQQIIQMKLNGEHLRAERLIKSYHKDGTQLKKQLITGYNNHIKQLKQSHKICQNPYCTNPVVQGKYSCQNCLDYQNDKYQLKKLQGKCVYCNQEAILGKHYCQTCSDKICAQKKIMYYINKSKSICPRCLGKSRPNKVYCQSCADKMYELRKKRRKSK